MLETAPNTQTTEPAHNPIAHEQDEAQRARAIDVEPQVMSVAGVVRAMTWRERRQSRKAKKEMERRTGDLYRLRMNYGEEIGTPDFTTDTPTRRIPTRLTEMNANRTARRIRKLGYNIHDPQQPASEAHRPTPARTTEEAARDLMFGQIGDRIQGFERRRATDQDASPYLGIRWPELKKDAKDKGKRDDDRQTDSAQLAKLRLYIGTGIENEVKRIKQERGLADEETLSLEEFDDIRDRMRKFYVDLYLEGHSSLSKEAKSKLRTDFGIEEPAESRGTREPRKNTPVGERTDLDDKFPRYLSEDMLDQLDTDIAQAIRDEAHRRKDERGVASLPKEEFRELVSEVRDELLYNYFDTGENVPGYVKAEVRARLRNKRTLTS